MHGSRVTGRKEDGEASNGREGGSIARSPYFMSEFIGSGASAVCLRFIIPPIRDLARPPSPFHPKTIQNLMNAKASPPRPFGVLPSRLGAYSPLPPSSRGIRSLPENLSFVTVGQLNVTLASPTLSLLFSISVGRG